MHDCNILVEHSCVGMNLLLGFEALFLLISVPWVKLSRTRDTQQSVVATPHPPICKALRTNKSVRGFCQFLDMLYHCIKIYHADSLLTIGASHRRRLVIAFEKLNQQDCMPFHVGCPFLYGCFKRFNVVVVIEMDACIRGCLFSMGAFSPDYVM